jgi:hypothetical protein
MSILVKQVAPLALVVFGACASHKTYTPVTTTGAELAGSPAASYSVPPTDPNGDVKLASYGVERQDPGARARAIHLGMAVSNRSDETWLVDTGAQRLVIRGKEVTPERPGKIEVAPRSSRFVDLVFPLPSNVTSENEVPAFDVQWTVLAGARHVVAGATSFEATP